MSRGASNSTRPGAARAISVPAARARLASRREALIKRLRRADKQALIGSERNELVAADR